jgi:hypothetical protein
VLGRCLVFDAGNIGLLQILLGPANVCVGPCSEKIESHEKLVV